QWGSKDICNDRMACGLDDCPSRCHSSRQNLAVSRHFQCEQHRPKSCLGSSNRALDAVDKMLEAFDDRRKTMVKILNDIEGFHCPMPKGAFYAYVDVTKALGKEIGGQRVDTSAELAAVILEKAQVAVVPGEAF